jgi:hypothetical protein
MATRAENLKQVAEATGMTTEQIDALEMTDDELEIYATAFVPGTDDETPEAVEDLVEESGEPDPLFTEDATDDAELPSEEEIQAAVEALSDEELEELATELGITDETAEVEESAETEETPEAAVTEETPEAAVTEEVPAEPTDADLVERLADGRWESGIRETPADSDSDLGELTDEALAEMWDTLADIEADASARGGVDTAPFTGDDEIEVADDNEPAAVASKETTPETPKELVGAGAVTLSNEGGPETVALSQQVNILQRELAEQKFTAMKANYVRQGVPAALVDLAKPVLIAGNSAVLEFSNSSGQRETVDAAEIVRQLLDSATGYIDLARERGHAYPMTTDDLAATEADEDKRLAHMWGEAYNR